MKERKSVSSTAMIVKDREIGRQLLRRGLEGYKDLLERSGVCPEDINRNAGHLKDRIEAHDLSQRNAGHLLDFFESVRQPKKEPK